MRKLGLDPSVARRKVELLAEFDVVAPDVSDILAAIDLQRLQRISFWDALVVRAAGQAGCVVLFSEDMQDRREVEGVRIVSPFMYPTPEQQARSYWGMTDSAVGWCFDKPELRTWRVTPFRQACLVAIFVCLAWDLGELSARLIAPAYFLSIDQENYRKGSQECVDAG